MKIFSLFLQEDLLDNKISKLDRDFLLIQIPKLIQYGYTVIEVLNFSGIIDQYEIDEFLEYINTNPKLK